MTDAHNAPDTTARDLRLAQYYDLEYIDHSDDIPFYTQFAQMLDPNKTMPVLELGCGTGRIALAFAQAGFKLVAVDLSQGMLSTLRQKAEDAGVGDMITTISGDMRDLSGVPHSNYGLAYCALNTFAYLTTTADQLSMLTAVRSLMTPGGTLLLDVTPPWPHLLPPEGGEVIHQGTYPINHAAKVHKLVTGRVDHATQTHKVTLMYDYEDADGYLTRTTQQLTFRWSGRYEMELLLKNAGWTLLDLYGSYDLDEFSDSSGRMIFVARA